MAFLRSALALTVLVAFSSLALGDGDPHYLEGVEVTAGRISRAQFERPLDNKDADAMVSALRSGYFDSLQTLGAALMLEHQTTYSERDISGVSEALGRAHPHDEQQRKVALSELPHFINSPYGSVRQAAAEALGNINTLDAVAPLVGALRADDAAVRKSAMQGLVSLQMSGEWQRVLKQAPSATLYRQDASAYTQQWQAWLNTNQMCITDQRPLPKSCECTFEGKCMVYGGTVIVTNVISAPGVVVKRDVQIIPPMASEVNADSGGH